MTVYIILALFLIFSGMLYWAYRRGRDGQRLSDAETTLEAVDRANKATDAVRRDPDSDYSERVRGKYRRD